MVHPKNVLDAIPLDELRGILCGEITRWPGANGEAGAMHVYGLHSTGAIARTVQGESWGRVDEMHCAA